MKKRSVKFPIEGERAEALVALLGPKVMRELRTLLRLAAQRNEDTHSLASEEPAEPSKVEFKKAA